MADHTGPQQKPAAEIEIDEALVRRLLSAQHPDLAGLPLRHVSAGWDNVLFRLGDELTARLPRRAVAADLVEREIRWLPAIADRVALAVPAPLRVGCPDDGYPWAWSIGPWLPGRTLLHEPPTSPGDTAERMAEFLRALHIDAPDALGDNPVRGGPLSTRDDRMQQWAPALRGGVDVDAVVSRWRELLAVPDWDGPRQWLHGDLHRDNVLVRDGRLSAVIDFGDVCGGDPATDLSAAWIIVDASVRAAFRDALDHDDDTWRRAQGWALALGVAYAANSADTPAYWRMGIDVIEGVLAEPI